MAEPAAAAGDASPHGTPSSRYDAGVATGQWSDDPAQRAVLPELDRIHAGLLRQASGGWLGSLFGRGEPDALQGLYLWGGVGRGKTFLVDLLFDGLPMRDVSSMSRTQAADLPADRNGKRRIHFHRFMRDVHERLRVHAGERDPLSVVAHEWRAQLRVLVLDEFFVSDIGDAMLLGRLLERLFDEGVVLVTSSNTAPDALYRDGLQRVRFEPAIALIQQHCVVVELASSNDYRLRALTRSPVYRAPLDDGADAWLALRWQQLSDGAPQRDGNVLIDGRRIAVRARCKGSVWFDFAALCEGPRSAADYIEIASEFHTVLLGGVPLLDASRDDAARRFTTLIDELYDRHVNLVCTAAAAPPDLYTGERMAGAFERTASRLIEMHSAEYLALGHLA